jgi:hypothetical protein
MSDRAEHIRSARLAAGPSQAELADNRRHDRNPPTQLSVSLRRLLAVVDIALCQWSGSAPLHPVMAIPPTGVIATLRAGAPNSS